MVTNPVSGKVYVSNTEARNEVRFEGPGTFFGSTTVRGHLHEARITVLDGASVLPRHLNKHLDYAVVPTPAADKAKSLATPIGMAVTSERPDALRRRLRLEQGRHLQHRAARGRHLHARPRRITSRVSGGGPSGLVLDEAHGRLYVFTRFDNALSRDRHRDGERDRAPAGVQPRAGEREERPPGALRRAC